MSISFHSRFLSIATPVFFFLAVTATAEDWPTHRHDNARSATTAESPTFPLSPSWARLSPSPPKTAWARPAKWDAFAGNEGLQAMRDFDSAFHVTTAAGLTYFASSLDDAIHCLDSKSGEEKWVSFASAPIRLPPTIADGNAYFGSDDGFAYCVDATTGVSIWKIRAAPSDRLIPSDGRMISPWPVRTGILVNDGTAYFGASLLPWKNTTLWAVDMATGEVGRKGCFQFEMGNATLQGAFVLAGNTNLILPQGREQALRFDFASTKAVPSFPAAGGVSLSSTQAGGEHFLISGPKNQRAKDDVLVVSSAGDGQPAFTFPASHGVAAEGTLYTHSGDALLAIDLKLRADLERRRESLRRKAAKGITPDEKAELDSIPAKIPETIRWSIKSPPAHDFIVAGDFLFVASTSSIQAHRRDTGVQVWNSGFKATPLSLAFSDTRLYISTAEGHILTFAPK